MSNIGFAVELPHKAGEVLTEDDLSAVHDSGFDFVVWHAELNADAAADCAALQNASLKPIAIALAADQALGAPEKSLDIAETFCVPDLIIMLDETLLDSDEVVHRYLKKIKDSAALFDTAGLRLLLGLKATKNTKYAELVKQFSEDLDPEQVLFMPDILEMCRAGIKQPGEIIRSLPDRCPLLALCDIENFETKEPCALGDGCLDWEAIFDAGEEAAVEWYVCQTVTPASELESVRKSLGFLEKHA